MNKSFEEKLFDLSKKTFEEKNEQIDSNVLRRLKQARELAVASTQHKDDVNVVAFPAWLSSASTLTVFASTALIALTLFLQPEIGQIAISTPLDDIALLSSTEDLEFYENLDFYIWLDTQDNAT